MVTEMVIEEVSGHQSTPADLPNRGNAKLGPAVIADREQWPFPTAAAPAFVIELPYREPESDLEAARLLQSLRDKLDRMAAVSPYGVGQLDEDIIAIEATLRDQFLREEDALDRFARRLGGPVPEPDRRRFRDDRAHIMGRILDLRIETSLLDAPASPEECYSSAFILINHLTAIRMLLERHAADRQRVLDLLASGALAGV